MILLTREFAALDVELRAGVHVSRSTYQRYEFVMHNFEELERFYRGYGARLIQHPEGFFFLLARGSLLPTRMLSKGAMHLGQFIALKTRDPDITRTNGRINLYVLLADLEASVPKETLSKVYAPKRKEVLVGDRVHDEILRSLRTLEDMNFVHRQGQDIMPLEAIQRFADIARHGNEPTDAERLALQVNRGVIFGAGNEEEEGAEEEADDGGRTN
ncbi:chromosome partition protein MukE [Rhodoferax sp. U11-2br]|uniref:chromosome partition protein MukE n=1 Tax=Rhodoferax sp. U11-2br TaxID=2838878 RepID=UPI001BEA9FD5|nr:chromosome partition protein MukE [Rhodoferax sp. U11-2br]MBT3066280.1 chromosome partition protein MukE [Rhodoferax sp. U11-2br]